jgi:hypothetical protein
MRLASATLQRAPDACRWDVKYFDTHHNMSAIKSLIAVSILLIGAVSPYSICTEAVHRRKITKAEAIELVRASLPLSVANFPGLSFEECAEDEYFPGYYEFQVLWDSPPPTSPNIGFFKVDPNTGVVWDGVVCREYKSKALKKLQVQLRKQIGLTNEEYRKLHPKYGPMCEGPR